MKKIMIALVAILLTVGMLATSLISIVAHADPIQPEFTKVQPRYKDVYIGWTDLGKHASGYHVYLIPADDVGSAKDILVEGSNYTVIQGLTPDTKYYVEVSSYIKSAHGGVLESKRSEPERFRTRPYEPVQPKTNAEAEKDFYQMAKAKGLDDLHIAAIMGVYSLESGMDPTAVETIFDEPFEIGSKKQKAEKNGFDMAKIDPEYAKKFPAIKKAGIGFGAWTDTVNMEEGKGANTMLRKLAAKRGKDWYDLDLQFEYWYDGCKECPDAGYKNWHARDEFESAKTVEQATSIYLCKHVAGWNISPERAYSYMRLDKRVENARKILKEIKTGAYDESKLIINEGELL